MNTESVHEILTAPLDADGRPIRRGDLVVFMGERHVVTWTGGQDEIAIRRTTGVTERHVAAEAVQRVCGR